MRLVFLALSLSLPAAAGPSSAEVCGHVLGIQQAAYSIQLDGGALAPLQGACVTALDGASKKARKAATKCVMDAADRDDLSLCDAPVGELVEATFPAQQRIVEACTHQLELAQAATGTTLDAQARARLEASCVQDTALRDAMMPPAAFGEALSCVLGASTQAASERCWE